jgi:hypothetical protein
MEFMFNNCKYQIGSKLFPVNQISKAQVFYKDNTEIIDNIILSEKIDKLCDFETGRCYTNTEQIVQVGKMLKLNIEFYAGWIFLNNHPIHHGWAVLNGNVIDVGLCIKELEIMSQVNMLNEGWRKEIAPKLVKLKNMKIPAHEKYIFGKVPKSIVYVGCPDTRENAIKTFQQLIQRYPNHPSYQHKGQNAFGRSLLQKEMLKYE